jgi:hypothetical protein
MRRARDCIFLLILLIGGLAIAPIFFQTSDTNDSEIATRMDLKCLSEAVDAFKAYHRVDSIPRRIKLSETGNYESMPKLDSDSVRYLQKVWPGIQLKGIDWNGNGVVDPPDRGGDVVLEEDQILVFFLGGIPGPSKRAPTCKGFSVDPQNPTSSTEKRIGPFFDFASHRLRDLHGNGFYSYLDSAGLQPYAYGNLGITVR